MEVERRSGRGINRAMAADPARSNGPEVFNVYFSVVNFWLSSHIWLFRLVSSQLIGSAPRSDPARCSPQQHVTLSLRVT
ncbi:hypothetical protein EYF80_011873 [Liparis tanakae]|uniref:Uncharacterized protein n=1 Tax=Liparis tanakae TaxID=230148 RepID=A0A4Z2IIP2_9TELE|nr:hypothetical protein EYF80_011873 [Liparis tanakae]